MLIVGGLAATMMATGNTAILDWDNVNWNAGSTNQTFYNVEGSGVDVTISLSLSNDTNWYPKPYSWNNGEYAKTEWLDDSRDDNKEFGGDGYTQNEESLNLGVNFASDDRTHSYLDVTISFSKSVQGVNFELLDVDSYGYNYVGGYETGIQFVDVIEQIESEFQGSTGADGNVSYDSSKIDTATNGNDTLYYGNTILNDGGHDQSDNPASVLNIYWGVPVDAISFRYSPGSDSVRNPGQQAIGLSDISFMSYTPVPEPSTYIMGGLSSFFILFSVIRKQSKKSKMDA